MKDFSTPVFFSVLPCRYAEGEARQMEASEKPRALNKGPAQ